MNEKNTKKTVNSLLALLAICIVVTALSVLMLNDFRLAQSTFIRFLVTLFTCFGFVLLISLMISPVDNFLRWRSKNRIWEASSIMLFCIFLYMAVLKYIDLFAIPFMFPALLYLAVSSKQTAMMMNLFINLLFAILYAIAGTFFSVNQLISEMITLLLFTIGGIAMIAVMDTNKPRSYILKIASLVGIVQFVMTFVIMCDVIGIRSSVLNCLWIFVGTVISVCLYMTLMPLMEIFFKTTTNVKLAEYCNFDNKLLKQLATEAPGTFNHSLVVGNLSEACAAAIGENTLLARVCAYYHDVGKLVSPEYFSENTTGGHNPHDEIIPEVSVSMITKHTQYGYDLIIKEGMPYEVADVALQHHGDSVVQYFYNKAQNLMESKLSEENYCYKNPKPQTKIAAIVMITDTVEAATRANYGKLSFDEMSALIARLIKAKLNAGLLNDCDMTLNELDILRDTIIRVVPGLYHSRISYGNKQ